MKWIACSLLAAVLFLSCSKKSGNSDPLLGNWKYQYAIGGFSGRDTVQPDAVVRLQLNGDSTYAVYANNNLVQQGRFSMQKKSEGTLIYFTDRVATHHLYLDIEVIAANNGNRLLLTDNIVEGYASFFTKTLW